MDDSQHERENELHEAIAALEEKKAELKRQIAIFKEANLRHEAKYIQLKQDVSVVTRALQKGTNIFSLLFEDTHSALQVTNCPVLSSPSLKKSNKRAQNVNVGSVTLCNTNNMPEQARITAKRGQFPLKPLNMQILSELSVAGVQELQPLDESSNGRLTTIFEESRSSAHSFQEAGLSPNRKETSSNVDKTVRELTVRLSRLPADVVSNHLQPPSVLSENRSNISLSSPVLPSTSNGSFTISPSFCSTPLKLQTMARLGLHPTETNKSPINKFVSIRKKLRNRNEIVSPKKEQVSPKKESLTPVQKSRKRACPSQKDSPAKSKTENRRPTRKAKPAVLKEESLKKKKRRA